MPTGAKALSKEIEICDIDDTNAHLFEIADDRYGELLWAEDSVPAGNVEPGTELVKEWSYFGGGMGETYDIEEWIGARTGGYYFAKNCQVSNPFAIRPRQIVTPVTLTNNASPVTHFFETTDANAADKYVYCEAAAKIFKVNANGTLKETFACNTNTVCGQSAEWNSIWEVPGGDNEDRIALTTVNDEVNNTGGDDSWTARSTGEPKVQHFTIIENQIVAARSNRTVSKCSALDTDVDANWTGDYNVGPPGTVITKLVNVAGECGVGTRDGFYLWDTVSTSRQQLPLLAGVSDTENAAGTTVMGNLVLVPTVDGLWRLVAGSAAQIGPDANAYYAVAQGPTAPPIRLKHYWSAFLGTYVYNACYDGTNYHIIYTRLDPSHPTLLGSRWNFLLSTTTAIKALFIDSNRKLWFSYGNNIAYVTLARGGAPEGGTWGDAGTFGDSASAGLYLPITNMGTTSLKRLRMIEFDTDNTPANFTWAMCVLRDGGAYAGVGAAASADGHNERFWTAGTNDTARDIQLYPVWGTATGYTTVSTPPELKRVVLHAEPLEEDADVIVCSVKLTKPREQKAIIDRHLNAGTLKLKNALTGVKETAHLFSRRIYQLQQEGNEPAIAACELRFRRSDTS